MMRVPTWYLQTQNLASTACAHWFVRVTMHTEGLALTIIGLSLSVLDRVQVMLKSTQHLDL